MKTLLVLGLLVASTAVHTRPPLPKHVAVRIGGKTKITDDVMAIVTTTFPRVEHAERAPFPDLRTVFVLRREYSDQVAADVMRLKLGWSVTRNADAADAFFIPEGPEVSVTGRDECVAKYWITGGELFQIAPPDIRRVLLKVASPKVEDQEGGGRLFADFDAARDRFYEKLKVRMGDKVKGR